jgi:hypothetical protein
MSEAQTPGSARRRRRRPHPTPPSSARSEPESAPKAARSGEEAGRERGLRELVGGGKSQLGVSGALRGRDVNRPSEDDLMRAEAEVVIVRRHWTPPPSSSDR